MAPNAIVDITPGNKLWRIELPVFKRHDTVIQALRNSVCLLNTTHIVTTPRIETNGVTAKLCAIVEAQHLLSSNDPRHCLMKNWYDVSLVRDGERWSTKHMVVDGVWFTGEPRLLMSQ